VGRAINSIEKKIAEEMETVYRENNKDGKGQR